MLGSCPISRITSLLPGLQIGFEKSALGTVLVLRRDLESLYNPRINALSYKVLALVLLELPSLRIALVEEYPGSAVGRVPLLFLLSSSTVLIWLYGIWCNSFLYVQLGLKSLQFP